MKVTPCWYLAVSRSGDITPLVNRCISTPPAENQWLNICQPAAANAHRYFAGPAWTHTPFPGLLCPLLVAAAAQWVLSGYRLTGCQMRFRKVWGP